VLAEVLVGAEQELPFVVVHRGMAVTVFIGLVIRVTGENRVRRIRDVEGDEAAVPVRDESKRAVRGRLGAVAEHRVGVASLGVA
jgi:hypothetical protein